MAGVTVTRREQSANQSKGSNLRKKEDGMIRFARMFGVTALLGGMAWMAVADSQACEACAKRAAKPQNIDVALCLDVSNSMDGLIDSAKNKLWDIVNELAKVKP